MFVLTTAGHVDHGKSTLIKHLTGMEPDRLPEEKKRGMTIDLGFVWMETPGGTTGIVDVPGHKRFVKNMVSGVGPVDGFLFVVAADDGWMEQSEEHLKILSTLGTQEGIAVVTKTDLVTPDRTESVISEVEEKLSKTLGHKVPVVPFSSVKKTDIERVRAVVLELLEHLQKPKTSGSSRYWIDRKFAPKGLGVVVTGSLAEGSVNKSDTLYLWPKNQTCTIKSLQSYHKPVEKAEPVCRLAIQLGQVSLEDISRGMLLTHVPPIVSKKADARITFFAKPLKKNTKVKFYLGTLESECLFVPMKGGSGLARLKFAKPVPLRFGDRFLLRFVGEERSIGGGIILDPFARSSTQKKAEENLGQCGVTVPGFLKLEAIFQEKMDLKNLVNASVFTEEDIFKELETGKYTKPAKAAPAKPVREKPPAAEEARVLKELKVANGAVAIADLVKKGCLKDLVFQLVKEKKIVGLADRHFLDLTRYEGYKKQVKAHIQKKGEGTVSDLKTVLDGCSRKYALLILERMDQDRLTYLKNGVRKLL